MNNLRDFLTAGFAQFRKAEERLPIAKRQTLHQQVDQLMAFVVERAEHYQRLQGVQPGEARRLLVATFNQAIEHFVQEALAAEPVPDGTVKH